jgi:YD repeat-containing protein
MNFDAVGNLTTTTDFNGDTIALVYDERNRLVKKQFPDSSTVDYTYTDNNLRETVVDARGTTTYSYDARDRLVSLQDPDGSAIAYEYDAAGNRTKVTTTVLGNPPRETTYTFDVLNRLQTVIDPESLVTTYHYDELSNLTRTEFPNGVDETRTYDDLNRLTLLETSNLGGVIDSYAYELDGVGNRTAVDEHDGRRVEYEYDELYRLVGEHILDPGSLTPSRTIDYIYDPVGNRLARYDTAEGLTTYKRWPQTKRVTLTTPMAIWSPAAETLSTRSSMTGITRTVWLASTRTRTAPSTSRTSTMPTGFALRRLWAAT